MSKALLLALQITCMFLSPAQALPASHRLLKRAVSWIAPSDPRAASSICSPQQQQQIAQWQSESMAIAAKGRDALDLLSEALSSEGSTDNWWALDDYDRLRLQVSFQAVLAGKITPDVQQDRLSRATTIRGIFNSIANLGSPDAWPTNLRIGCDSSIFQPTKQDGTTWQQDLGPDYPPPAAGRNRIWDADLGGWDDVPDSGFCEKGISNAWTVTMNGQTRVVLCPQTWQVVGDQSLTQTPITTGQTDVRTFRPTGTRVFFHEMMHATAVHGIDPSDPNFPKDFGYGFDKITSLAQSNAVQSFTNADTLTYWCILMYFDQYKWANGIAGPVRPS